MKLTVRGLPVLVVGGGAVGRRKAGLLAAAGAVVTIVDPGTVALSLTGVRHTAEAFADSHLAGVRLAFACATPEVNRVVVAAARARGVWVCSASEPSSGDFVLPSAVSRGELTFTVSTGGASPALAKRIAAGLLDQFDDSYAEWVRVLGEVRTAVLRDVSDANDRRRLLEGFADPRWLERVRTAGAAGARAEMLACLGVRRGEGEPGA